MWKTNVVILFFVLLFVALTIGLSGYRDMPAPEEGASPEYEYQEAPYYDAIPEDDIDGYDRYYDDGPLDEESPPDPGEPEIFEAAFRASAEAGGRGTAAV
ncbi:MAG: hypothetical protein LBO21_06490 [Synergistaceae bacterium]|jgi:hypothetical protein|nr:hypothetical protein [Synergistaceae bacterium]